MTNRIEQESKAFAAKAAATEFAIETSAGFLGKDGKYHKTIKISDIKTFNWLEQDDHLIEAMEEIASTANGYFRVICITPFKD